MDSESRKALGLLLDAINKEQIAQNDRIAKLEEQNKALQDHVEKLETGANGAVRWLWGLAGYIDRVATDVDGIGADVDWLSPMT